MSDLRALFGSNDRGLSAGEAFTNRQDQWQALDAALSAHLRHIADSRFDVEDLGLTLMTARVSPRSRWSPPSLCQV
ncbi:hypothetical protein [Streptomyces iranensis]|uniref:Uncharacterized protein n=1 Tax=Streptomyces iranensis TaxID=576784 RepID=A0A060ZAU0_9ACTN|nr:hypothetical protein [Streptomyces iranensis]MBP2068787.1 hypothetical protein [Streptomyces iranensis]CDR01166.1 predicted protein [Streptomyces iranensis]